jgi:transposase
MNKIKQILRCYAHGMGLKSISSVLSVSRNTVRRYVRIYQECGVSECREWMQKNVLKDKQSFYTNFYEASECSSEVLAKNMGIKK